MRKKRIRVYIREYSSHPGPVGVRWGGGGGGGWGLGSDAFALLHVPKESKNSKSVCLDNNISLFVLEVQLKLKVNKHDVCTFRGS